MIDFVLGSNPSRAERTAVTTAGCVYWITGLSGVGKTTLSLALVKQLTLRGHAVIRLDGDRIRALLGGSCGYDQNDRYGLSQIYGRLCLELAEQGHDVVCATISMFHEIRSWNRANIRRYIEIYLRMPIEQLVERDPDGLYARCLNGQVHSLPGVDLPLEEPSDADIMLDAARPAAAVAAELFAHLIALGKSA